MKIINKYLFKEYLINYLVALLALVGIFIVFHFLEELGNDYPMAEKIRYVFYSIPVAANNIFSMAILIGVITKIGQFNSNSELQIFYASSISKKQIINKTLVIGFILSLASLTVGELLSPYFSEKSMQIKAHAQGKNFTNKNANIWLKNENLFINIGSSLDKFNLSEVYFYDTTEHNKLKKIIYSKNARIVNDSITLSSPRSLAIDNSMKIPGFLLSNDGGKFELPLKDFDSLSKDERTMNLYEIFSIILVLSRNGLDADIYIIEFFNRLLKPIYITGLILMAVPFTMSYSRNRSIGSMVFAGIILALIFSLLTKFLNVAALNFGLDVYLASIFPTFIILVAGLSFTFSYLRYK